MIFRRAQMPPHCMPMHNGAASWDLYDRLSPKTMDAEIVSVLESLVKEFPENPALITIIFMLLKIGSSGKSA